MRSVKAGLRLSIIRYLAAAYRVSLDLYPNPCGRGEMGETFVGFGLTPLRLFRLNPHWLRLKLRLRLWRCFRFGLCVSLCDIKDVGSGLFKKLV
jgi:hypothetical protein